jgi:hypothetical protein
LGGLGIIIAVGAVLILGFAGISYIGRWIWGFLPFGISGFGLGLIIIAATFFLSKRFSPERKFAFGWNYLNQMGFLEILGLLYGSAAICAAILWFFLPDSVIRLFPSGRTAIGFYIILPLMIYGGGKCLEVAIISRRIYIVGSLFYAACGIFSLGIINYPLWTFSETLPDDVYLFGKIALALIIFLQILYLIFFHCLPAFTELNKISANGQKKR